MAAFSTRVGGSSSGPFAALNLGLHTGDDPLDVTANRVTLAQALDRDPDGVLIGSQVHEATVLARQEPPRPNPYTDPNRVAASSDGQATPSPDLTPLVTVADCLPVALVGRSEVAVLHCGWRGLAAGLIERGVEAIGATAAAIGPGIGRCCSEVGEEVLDRFASLGNGVSSGPMLDLPEVARLLLGRAGVEEVESAGLCTSCEPGLFFSHRRDGVHSGRQAGLVWSLADG
jgi:YfiH family protein